MSTDVDNFTWSGNEFHGARSDTWKERLLTCHGITSLYWIVPAKPKVEQHSGIGTLTQKSVIYPGAFPFRDLYTRRQHLNVSHSGTHCHCQLSRRRGVMWLYFPQSYTRRATNSVPTDPVKGDLVWQSIRTRIWSISVLACLGQPMV